MSPARPCNSSLVKLTLFFFVMRREEKPLNLNTLHHLDSGLSCAKLPASNVPFASALLGLEEEKNALTHKLFAKLAQKPEGALDAITECLFDKWLIGEHVLGIVKA